MLECFVLFTHLRLYKISYMCNFILPDIHKQLQWHIFAPADVSDCSCSQVVQSHRKYCMYSYHLHLKVKRKVIPLQARCGPEGG